MSRRKSRNNGYNGNIGSNNESNNESNNGTNNRLKVTMIMDIMIMNLTEIPKNKNL
jgi:hypothetical protein